MPSLRGTMYSASRNVLMRLVRIRFISGGSSMPSMTTSSWFSASPPPPPIIPGIIMPRIAPASFSTAGG